VLAGSACSDETHVWRCAQRVSSRWTAWVRDPEYVVVVCAVARAIATTERTATSASATGCTPRRLGHDELDSIGGVWMALAHSRTTIEGPGPAITSIAESASEQPMTARVSYAVRLAQAGDRDALGFLYARYADNVYDHVRSIVHDPHDAEDVTQQVFAELIHSIDKYDERELPFFAWILRVACNLAVSHPRCQRVVPVEEVSSALRDRDCDANGALGSERARPGLSRTVWLRAKR
jgi:hypothetical protein